jgi:hypothetical protein
VTVETSLWPHDSDRFRLSSPTADTVQLVFTRPLGDSTWERIAFVNDAATGKPRFWSVNYLLEDRLALPRVDLAPGDAYDVVLEGYTRRWTPGMDAPFGLTVRRVSAAPEHHEVAIAFGDTVRDSIDFEGDIDDFTLRGTPGQEINVSASWPSNYAPIDFGVALDDPATGRTLARSNFLWNYSPTATIPGGGVVRVRACSNASCAVPRCEIEVCRPSDGGLVRYSLVVHRIDRAPEQVLATYTLGDVVSGEKVDQPGDIDEYVFDGSAGQTVQAALQWYTPFDRSMPGPGLQLDLIDVASGQLLTSVLARYKTVEVDDISSPPVVLPTTGRYLVRVRSQDGDPQSPYIHNYGEYRFRVGAPR